MKKRRGSSVGERLFRKQQVEGSIPSSGSDDLPTVRYPRKWIPLRDFERMLDTLDGKPYSGPATTVGVLLW